MTKLARDAGGTKQAKEKCRDTRGVRFLEVLARDIRFALRMLRRSSGFAITTIVTLSLGMAATVAIFGFVDSALIRPLPYPDVSRLMGVFETSPSRGQQMGYSYPNYFDLERFNNVFASIAGYDVRDGLNLSDSGTRQPVGGVRVTDSFFRTLGVEPILGRDFVPHSLGEDLRASPLTVILSYGAWQKRFFGRPDVLGKSVTLNDEAYSVIGVLPRSFEFAPTGSTEFWTPLHPSVGDACHLSRGCTAMRVIARLKDGVTLRQALADVQVVAAQEASQHPDPDKNRGANILPLSQWILGDIQPILTAMLSGAGLLLLIAYVNVAGLLLARSENRRREFAVRGVLGASRGRVIQQFIGEGLVLVATSSALGLLAATLMRQLLLRLIPTDMLNFMPYLRGAGWNWHVTVFAAALLLISSTVFAITPAIRLPFANLQAGLSEGGRGGAGTAWRNLGAKLVVLELAATMVLLAGAGLFGQSLLRLMSVDVGFVPNHLATLYVLAPESKYSNGEQASALQKEIASRLQSLPSVTEVGLANNLPLGGQGGTQIGFVGRPSLGVNNEVGHVPISSGYFSVLQGQLLRGRYFNEHDNVKAPLVAIINQTLARQYFLGENPIGKQFFYHAHDIKLEGLQPPIQIVGVIADIQQNALDEPASPVVYTPFEQGMGVSFAVVVRTSQDAASVLPSLIAAVHRIESEIITSRPTTMPEIIHDSPAAYWHRASAWLGGAFAALALLLSAVGLYGVIAYSVSQRTREIGVRMALGAQRISVYQLILWEAAWLVGLGIAAGTLASMAFARLIQGLLFGVRSWDVTTLVGAAGVLAVCALAASYIPARRAAKVDPMVALRYE